MKPADKHGHGNTNPATGQHRHGNIISASGAHRHGNEHDTTHNADNAVAATNAAADAASHAVTATAAAVYRDGNTDHPVLWSNGTTNL